MRFSRTVAALAAFTLSPLAFGQARPGPRAIPEVARPVVEPTARAKPVELNTARVAEVKKPVVEPTARAKPVELNTARVAEVKKPAYAVDGTAEFKVAGDGKNLTSRASHNREANRLLSERFQADPNYAKAMNEKYPGIVERVAPGPRGGTTSRAPHPDAVWHHRAGGYDVNTKTMSMELMSKTQHTDPALQKVLHPEGKGGYSDMKADLMNAKQTPNASVRKK